MEITYKGRFGNVTQTVEHNQVGLPNLMETTIFTGDHIPKIDEEVYLTSCIIPYHNDWDDSWVSRPNDDEYFSKVILELVSYDDSNYEPSKSRDGGSYLESVWVIREIKDTYTFAEI